MRIGVISASRVPSRAANSIQVMKVCQAIMNLGHELQLWVPGPASDISEEDLKEWYGLQRAIPITWISSSPPLRRYDFAWKAVNRARAWDADLVYCWPLQAAALSAGRGIRTILEIHDRPQGLFGPLLMRTFLKAKGAWRILPITKALRDWLAGNYSIQLEKPFCMIAPMGVDLGQYEGLPESEHARKTLGLMEAFTVGYAGHLYEGRGLDLMVDLATRCPELQFIWIGGEPGAVNSWQKSLRTRGVENIQVLGFVPNEQLPLYQAACEILLMPYEHHIAGSSGGDTARFASPMKTFEYMASGRVILASDLPVLREVLDEQVALLLPPEDIEAWVRALKELIDDPERMQRLSIAAKARASQYGWKARASRTLEGLEDD